MEANMKNITVVEASSGVGAPIAAKLLADVGARVIKVEHVLKTDFTRRKKFGKRGIDWKDQAKNNAYFGLSINANKKSISLDLGTEKGREIIYRLLEKADVFLSNFRPFQLEKFGLEYETLSKLNPRLIFAAFTGYGRKGPDRNAPSFGPVNDARSGLLHVLQRKGSDPVQMPLGYADYIAGLISSYGILCALLIREMTGIAQEVDVSLLNSGVWMLSSDVGGALQQKGMDRQALQRREMGTPLINSYQTKDGRWFYMMIDSNQHKYWPKICRAIGREDLEEDPKFKSPDVMSENSIELFNILEEVFLSRPLDEWRPILTDLDIPWAPLQTMPEVVEDPQAIANDFFVPFIHPEHGEMKLVRNPVKFSRTPWIVKEPAPTLGQHNEEILKELGYSSEEISSLREKGLIT